LVALKDEDRAESGSTRRGHNYLSVVP
jgi:hypothetical protein